MNHATQNDTQITLSPGEVYSLRNEISGPVMTPDSPEYPTECANFNLNRLVEPAVVVGAESANDVAAAIRFATRRGMPVAVQNAGHQVVLPVSDNWLLITTSRMDDLAVDPDARTARVGAGVRWRQVLIEAAKSGLAPIAGSAPDVGIVGYTLGGGLSPLLGRSLGYAADHVRWMEVVTAEGRIRAVTADSDPELFWALLGGKGNFGIVTRIEFGLFPVTEFYGGGIWFRGEDMAAVLEVWRAWVPTLGEETTTSVAIQRLPDLDALPEPLRGAFVLHVRIGHLGGAATGAKIVAPVRAAATPLLDSLMNRPFTEIGEIHLDPVERIPYVESGTGLREMSAETIDTIVALTGPDSGCPLASVEIRALGGALDREAAVPNAVPSRGVPFITFAFGVGSPAELGPMQDYLNAYVERLAPWADDATVVNFVSPDEAVSEEGVRRLFGPDLYTRLAAVKRQYDPANVFRINHNIRPSSS
ncbi:FAD-binding oxidoreductase [Streptomyces nigra]|uniref:FAD-binding oxidoreductase n=1 Tax=Streptomyces nigra TaxID=1827580 RepID=UPI0037FDDF88